MVGKVCDRLGVRHAILTARWSELPKRRSRSARATSATACSAIGRRNADCDALATAHHAEDQAETLLMRLSRGSGVGASRGCGHDPSAPGAHVRLVRPLLGWRRAELEQICARCRSHARCRSRATTTNGSSGSGSAARWPALDWLDAGAVAHSAANLADADAALDWAAKAEWDRQCPRTARQHCLPPLGRARGNRPADRRARHPQAGHRRRIRAARSRTFAPRVDAGGRGHGNPARRPLPGRHRVAIRQGSGPRPLKPVRGGFFCFNLGSGRTSLLWTLHLKEEAMSQFAALAMALSGFTPSFH